MYGHLMGLLGLDVSPVDSLRKGAATQRSDENNGSELIGLLDGLVYHHIPSDVPHRSPVDNYPQIWSGVDVLQSSARILVYRSLRYRKHCLLVSQLKTIRSFN